MKENDESQDRQGRVGTCFDGFPCAEMMQKIMGEHEVGSLCEEMMKACLKESRGNPDKPRDAVKDESKVNGGAK